VTVPPAGGASASGADQEPLEQEWPKKKPTRSRSSGGVAIALVTLLLLLGGFGYVLYRKIKKSSAEQVAATNAPADPAATPPASPPPATPPADPAAPAIALAGAQTEPAPAAPAVDPLANVEPLPPANPAPAIPADNPVLANVEPAPPAAPPTPPPAARLIEEPDPAGDPLANSEPPPAASTPLPLEIPEDPLPAGPAANAAARLEEMEEDPLPTAPPVAAPALEPEIEPAPPAQPSVTIELKPRPAPLLDSPATAGPVEEPPLEDSTPSDRLGSFEPTVEEDSVVVPSSPVTAGPATDGSRLPSARAETNRSARYGDFEPDPETPRPARINTIGGEAPTLAQTDPAAVPPATAIVPRRQVPTPAIDGGLEPAPGAVPAQVAPAGIYVVAPNDNFWLISRKVYGAISPYKALAEHFRAAGLEPQQLRPGMQLAIPPRAHLEATYPQLIEKPIRQFVPGANPATSQTAPIIGGGAPVVAAGASYDEQPAAAAAPAVQSGVYTVVANDSFYLISRKAYGSIRPFKALEAHFESQGITTAQLRPGMQLPLPSRQELENRYPTLVDRSPAAPPGANASPVLARGRMMTSGPSFGDSPALVGPTLTVPETASKETVEDDGGFYVDERGLPMYRVGSDDTLTGISQRHLGRASRWSEIYELNQSVMKTPDQMRPGLVLQLPGDASRLAEAPGGLTRQ
jgi:nucleoid-associated protein YgaU